MAYHKKIIGLLATLILVSFSISITNAQDCNSCETKPAEKKVVMNSAELQNIVEALVRAKRARAMKIRRDHYYRSQYNNRNVAVTPQQPQQQDNSAAKLAELEKMMGLISNQLNAQPADDKNRGELEALKYQMQQEISALKNRPTPTTNPNPPVQITNSYGSDDPNRNNDAAILLLNRQLEEMRNRLKDLDQPVAAQPPVVVNQLPANTPQAPVIVQQPSSPVAPSPNYQDLLVRIAMLENELKRRPTPAANTEVIIKEVTRPVAATPVYNELSYLNNTKRDVFFNHGSPTLLTKANVTLDEVVSLLRMNSRVEVRIKGYASQPGTLTKNNSLSQQRAENVKRYLINKGIGVERIRTEFHGVDYSAVSPEYARRVEIYFVAHP